MPTVNESASLAPHFSEKSTSVKRQHRNLAIRLGDRREGVSYCHLKVCGEIFKVLRARAAAEGFRLVAIFTVVAADLFNNGKLRPDRRFGIGILAMM
jgi:hypothetical protein